MNARSSTIRRDDGTTATVYVQSGQQTVADYVAGTTASSPKYRYVYASYIDEPVLRYEPSTNQSSYYHRNQQYSIIALTDGVGAIQERYAYSAYGQLTVHDGSGTVQSGSDNRYTYTGREWDASLELYHYRARMYDAVAGRFLGRDPIGYGDGRNLYCYVGAAPLDHADPSGLFEVPDLSGIMGITGFAQMPIMYFPGGGLFIRADVSIKTGSCKCTCDRIGSYTSKTVSVEGGVFVGIMTPNIHVATPVVEDLESCPPNQDRLRGGATFRVVLGPIVGTCRWTWNNGGLDRHCTGSIRLTAFRASVANAQFTLHAIRTITESACGGGA